MYISEQIYLDVPYGGDPVAKLEVNSVPIGADDPEIAFPTAHTCQEVFYFS